MPGGEKWLQVLMRLAVAYVRLGGRKVSRECMRVFRPSPRLSRASGEREIARA